MSSRHLLDPAHSLEEKIGHALARQRRVRFRLSDGEVVLTGTVSTFFQKQMAQESLRRINGISRIVNELHVANH
jgi:osmotically-inducible protein OsmY